MSGTRAELYSEDGSTLVGYIEVPGGPICGLDFCEACSGDCMACYFCPHPRMVYEDELADFLEEHEGATLHRLASGDSDV